MPVLFTSLAALTQTALGCGLGMIVATKLKRRAQRATAVTVLAVGLLSTAPIIYDLVAKRINRPDSDRGLRKRLESIRHDSGFSEEAEVF
ncbi:MAG: hypothetical protein M3O82_08490 [Verrucomicrobiota bacterium]|nr:hypothetical protein [Verrucomicrobiota bacterium]